MPLLLISCQGTFYFHVFICVSICDRVLKVSERNILRIACRNFIIIYVLGADGDKDELVRFCSQRSTSRQDQWSKMHFSSEGVPVNGLLCNLGQDNELLLYLCTFVD